MAGSPKPEQPSNTIFETPTNVLANPALDPVAKIPELKVCAAKLNKIRGG